MLNNYVRVQTIYRTVFGHEKETTVAISLSLHRWHQKSTSIRFVLNFETKSIPFYSNKYEKRCFFLTSHKNVINGNVNQLDKESDKSHDGETDSDSLCDGGKFLAIGLGAFLYQVHGILCELPKRLDGNFLESFFFSHFFFYVWYLWWGSRECECEGEMYVCVHWHVHGGCKRYEKETNESECFQTLF